MSATVKVGRNTIVRIDQGEWATSDPRLTRALALLGESRDKPVYDPNSDLTEATYVAEILGGEVLYTDPMPALPEGGVW